MALMVGDKEVASIVKGLTRFDKSYAGMKCNVFGSNGTMYRLGGGYCYNSTHDYATKYQSVVLGSFDLEQRNDSNAPGKYYVVKTKAELSEGALDDYDVIVIISPDDNIEFK